MSTEDRNKWEKRYGHPRQLQPPSTFLLRHLEQLPVGTALDLACGTGRHSLALARAGFRVDAIDVAGPALDQLEATARAEGLEIRPLQSDLERCPLLSPEHYDLVVNIRYLQRDLAPVMMGALKPGGILLFETFLAAQRELGHPRNPAYLLEPGELRNLFAALQLLDYEEGLFESELGPAHLARLLARKL